ncbi:MAG: polysaccharide deacetylase family protein [Candidatus Xenobiia bacterium LiM19]
MGQNRWRSVIIGAVLAIAAVSGVIHYLYGNHSHNVEAYTAVELMKGRPPIQVPAGEDLISLLKSTNSLDDYDRVMAGRDILNPVPVRVYHRIATLQNTVFLTFDDGPYADGDGAQVSNERLLQILTDKSSTATFFFQGPWALKNADLVRKTADMGNTIGNHTYHHPPDGCNMGPIECERKVKLEYLDATWQTREILWCRIAVLEALDGDRTALTPYFRAPHGSGVISTRRKPANHQLLATIGRAGYVTINGNLGLSDATKKHSKDQLLSTYRKHFKKDAPGFYRGEILWLHSGLSSTAEALPEIIDMLHGKGYKVMALPSGL